MTQQDLLNAITGGAGVKFKYVDYNVFKKAREVLAEHKRDITDREEYVVRHLYNFGAPKWTAEKLSKKFGVTVARIYQIKNATLTKLRHPEVRNYITVPKPAPTAEKYFENELTVRTTNCLLAEGIYTREQAQAIWDKNPNDFLKIPNLGRRCFNEIKDWLARHKQEEVKAEPTPEPKRPTIAVEILDNTVNAVAEAKKNTSVIKNMDNELARGFRNVSQDIQTLTARIIKLETAVERLTPSKAKDLAPLDDLIIKTMAEATPLTAAAFKEFTRMVEKAHGIK